MRSRAQRIRDRLLAPGARLPSVRQCALQQGVSPSTVVAAYDQLLAQGLVEARKNSGFFVRETRSEPIAARTGERQPPNGGSPFTRSPQQAAGLPAAPADDLYSFGALLHELLSGHPPHYPDRAAVNVEDRRPPRLKPLGAVPVRIERLIERLLDPEPAARPASMRDVIAELEVSMNETQPLGSHETEAADKPASEVAVTPRWRAPAASGVQGKSGGGQRGWPWAAAAVLLAAAVIVFVVLPRYAPTPAPVTVSPVEVSDAEPATSPVVAPNAASAAARAAALRAQTRYTARAAALERRHAVAWSGPQASPGGCSANGPWALGPPSTCRRASWLRGPREAFRSTF